MPWTEHLPRPHRSLAEWLTSTRVAPVMARWHGVARLQKHFPALFTRPVQRIYQLGYLDEQNEALFAAGLVAGKSASICQLGKLEYGEDALGLTVLSDLVRVYLLRAADSPRGLVLVVPPCGKGAPRLLPVPSCWLLLLLLLSSKTILR